MRWYDRDNAWIPTDAEARQTAEQQAQAAEQQAAAAAAARRSAIPRLASMGLTAPQIAEALSLSIDTIEQLLPPT